MILSGLSFFFLDKVSGLRLWVVYGRIGFALPSSSSREVVYNTSRENRVRVVGASLLRNEMSCAAWLMARG